MLSSSDDDSNLQRLKWLLVDATLDLKLYLLGQAIRSYNPNQPRVPEGSPEGGQWISGEGGDNISPEDVDSDRQLRLAAMSRIARCEAQWKSDIFHCNMVGLPTCYAQAMVRFIACERGHSIPPLNY